MASFQFRLARALDWYRKQCQIEENRLRLCTERAAQAKAMIERHQTEVARRHRELIDSPTINAQELGAWGSFQRRANNVEAQLRQKSLKSDELVTRQRGVVQIAQRRLRLIEKLRERRFAEHRYEAERQLEELASESHLAAFARSLSDPSA